MDFQALFSRITRNAVQLTIERGEEVPTGGSKFGGDPDLPEGFQWPRFRGVDYRDIEAERPLSFLVQVNCAQAAPYDTEGALPKTGMLYFFYDLATMTWGYSPDDRGSARVYYIEDGPASLRRTPPPEDLEADYRMPELGIRFESRKNAPDYEELGRDFDWDAGSDPWDKYAEALAMAGFDTPDVSHKLLGHADMIQGDMLYECEAVSRGIHCGHPAELSPEEKREIREKRKEWRLLFQLDTVSDGDFELMFGDCGRIYYFIREGDLRAKKFENCWLISQCC